MPSLFELAATDGLQILRGCDVLNPSDEKIGEVDLASGRVSSNIYNRIHRRCELTIGEEINWGKDRLRPWVELAANGHSERVNMGVYLPAAPAEEIGATPKSWQVTGFDKLLIADQLIGGSFSAAAGTDVLVEVNRILTDELGTTALVDSTSAGKQLAARMTWGVDTDDTWLTVMNQLLAAVGYFGLWVDRDGRFRAQRITLPEDRAPIATYTPASIGVARTLDYPFTDAPNRWVFRSRSETDEPITEGAGLFTMVNQDDGPTSIDARGGFVITKIVDLDAVDQASLEAQGRRIVVNDKAVTRHLTLETIPNPQHWHLDVAGLADPAVVGSAWSVREWTFDLAGGDMKQRWEKVCRC